MTADPTDTMTDDPTDPDWRPRLRIPPDRRAPDPLPVDVPAQDDGTTPQPDPYR